jgi:hypothetical protein
MGFVNAVVGGITLVRAAIQSPNYVAGVSGWTINRDGTAEFNNVTVRGDLLVGSTPPSRFIGDTIPAELTAWGTPKGVTFFIVDIWYYDDSPLTYFFEALATFGAQLLRMNGTYDTNNSVYVWDRQFILGAGNLERRIGSSSLNTFAAAINYQQVNVNYASDAPVTAFTLGVPLFGSFSVDAGATIALPGKIYFDTDEYTTGTTTVTNASLTGASISTVIIRYQAPGAGGGGVAASGGGANVSMGGGGGGGGWIAWRVDISALGGGDIVITLPAAGTGGAAGNNPGNAPGASSVASATSGMALTATAPGGGGGGAGSGVAGFGGGGGNGGFITSAGPGTLIAVAHGGDGQNSIRQAGFYGQQGNGGSAFLTGGRRAAATAAGSGGSTAYSFGGGGSGAHDGTGNTARAGGDGGAGRVWIDKYRG